MPSFLEIERALNRLVGDPMTGRFHGTASVFENILKDNNLTPQQKAARIAEIIERGISQ